MIRILIELDDEMHPRLCELAERRGCTVSDPVREAMARVYGGEGSGERLATLRGIAGLWKDRGRDGDLEATDAYLRGLRRDTRRTGPSV